MRRPPGPAAALESRIPQILSAVSLPLSSSLAASLGRPARWGAHRSLHILQIYFSKEQQAGFRVTQKEARMADE